MNQKHVPNLELCQELDRLCKENNITLPETEFYWDAVAGGSIEIVKAPSASSNITNKERCHDELSNISIPAPLVSEQGDWLPNERRDKLAFFSGLAINGWFCEVKNYRVMPYERFHVILQEDTEANARMKCLLYLLENDIIDGNAFN